MRLTSTAFTHGSAVPKRYTCQGIDINPPLTWSDIPEGTKSFALIVDDPDAPARTWVHWLVKDIPANARKIPEDTNPGNQVMNSWGKEDWGGPCPPSGSHRYYFKLYALSVSSFEAANEQEFSAAVEKHKLADAVLMGTFKKS